MLKLLHKFQTPVTVIGPVRAAEDLIWASSTPNLHELSNDDVRSKVSFFQLTSSSLIPIETTDKKPIIKKPENPSQQDWNDVAAFVTNYRSFTAITKNGDLIDGSLDVTNPKKKEQRTVTTSVALNLTKYDLKRKPLQLFKFNDKGTFIFFFDLNGNFKLQYWNKFLNAVTLDIVLYPKELSDEIPKIRQVFYSDPLSLLLVLTMDNELLYLKPSDLTCPTLDLKYTVGYDAIRTNTILRFRRLTGQYIDTEQKKKSANESTEIRSKSDMMAMSLDGYIEQMPATAVASNETLLEKFSQTQLKKLSDSDLLAQIRELRSMLTPTVASKILTSIHEIEKEQDKIIYYESARYIYLKQSKLQQLPKEQVIFTLNKLLSSQELQNKTPFILQCCRLLSHFDGQRTISNALPLEVLPLLVSKFNANECWMMDACNLLIDIHFRSILSNPDMIAQLQQLRKVVRESQQIREAEARLRGMANALAIAPQSKQRSKTTAIELENF